MDLFTIQSRLKGLNRSFGNASVGGGSPAAGDRVKELLKKVNARKPFSNKWGGQDYPINVADYGQFLSTLQTLSWILGDMGYTIHYLTRSGLTYDRDQYLNHSNLFDRTQGHVVALVAVGKQGNHYRFTRDGKTLRIRSFNDVGRALAPTRDNDTAGTRPMGAGAVKEIVRFMARQSVLDPSKDEAIRKWGRVISNMKPVTGGLIKNQLKLEFKKFPR